MSTIQIENIKVSRVVIVWEHRQQGVRISNYLANSQYWDCTDGMFLVI